MQNWFDTDHCWATIDLMLETLEEKTDKFQLYSWPSLQQPPWEQKKVAIVERGFK